MYAINVTFAPVCALHSTMHDSGAELRQTPASIDCGRMEHMYCIYEQSGPRGGDGKRERRRRRERKGKWRAWESNNVDGTVHPSSSTNYSNWSLLYSILFRGRLS